MKVTAHGYFFILLPSHWCAGAEYFGQPFHAGHVGRETNLPVRGVGLCEKFTLQNVSSSCLGRKRFWCKIITFVWIVDPQPLKVGKGGNFCSLCSTIEAPRDGIGIFQEPCHLFGRCFVTARRGDHASEFWQMLPPCPHQEKTPTQACCVRIITQTLRGARSVLRVRCLSSVFVSPRGMFANKGRCRGCFHLEVLSFFGVVVLRCNICFLFIDDTLLASLV